MKSDIFRQALHLFFALILCTVLFNCEKSFDEEEKLRLLLYTPINTNADPYVGVSFLRMTAKSDALEGGETSHYIRFQPGVLQGDLGGIPFGPVQIEVAGHPPVDHVLNPETPLQAMVLSRGASTVMDISSTGGPAIVPILLAPSNTVVNTVAAPATPGPATTITKITNSRMGHSLTPMANGKVVIAGGGFFQGSPASWDMATTLDPSSFQAGLEIYDARTGVFVNPVLPSLSLQQPRAFHQAVLLSDGRVAFLGGIDTSGTVSTPTTEIYDPATNSISMGIPMVVGRADFTATPVPTKPDHFLLVGGRGQAATSWEVWTPTGLMAQGALNQARRYHSASPVAHLAKIFILGGENDATVLSAFEVFSGLTLAFDGMLYPMPVTNTRTMHSAVFVEDRRFIYLIGGFTDKDHSTLIPQIDVVKVDACTPQSCSPFIGPTSFRLATPRIGHATVALDQNKVLISGGISIQGGVATPLSDGEVIFETLLNGEVTVEVGAAGSMPEARFYHVGAPTETGHGLMVGGVTTSGAGFQGVLAGLLYNP